MLILSLVSCHYFSFYQDFVDTTLIFLILEIYWLLYKNLKYFLRKATVSSWYQKLDYKLIRDHVRLKINIS